VLRRTTFPVVIGLGFLSYATNLYLLTMGRLAVDRPPIISTGSGMSGSLRTRFDCFGTIALIFSTSPLFTFDAARED